MKVVAVSLSFQFWNIIGCYGRSNWDGKKKTSGNASGDLSWAIYSYVHVLHKLSKLAGIIEVLSRNSVYRGLGNGNWRFAAISLYKFLLNCKVRGVQLPFVWPATDENSNVNRNCLYLLQNSQLQNILASRGHAKSLTEFPIAVFSLYLYKPQNKRFPHARGS